MTEKHFKRFVIAFHCLCLISTATLILYWIYIFSLNEDRSKVDNIPFYQSKQDVFPVLSLCFKNPFSDNKLVMTGTGVNAKSYLKYLEGKQYAPEMKDIDYENITMDISEYIEDTYVSWRNGSSKTYTKSSFLTTQNKLFVNTFSGIWFEEMFYKCYGLQLLHDKQIESMSVLLKSTVFQNSNGRSMFNFFTLIHYPNQLLRSKRSIKLSWPKDKPNATLDMKFKINAMEVIRRRNKDNQPCNEGWRNHDAVILTSHTDKIGCRAPYQYPTNVVRKCSTMREMKNAQFTLRSDEYGKFPPCTSMDKILYTYEEDDLTSTKWERKGYFWIGPYLYNEQFKEIVQTK